MASGMSGNPVFIVKTESSSFVVKMFLENKKGNGYKEETKALRFLKKIKYSEIKFTRLLGSAVIKCDLGKIPIIAEEIALGTDLSKLFKSGQISEDVIYAVSVGLSKLDQFKNKSMQTETKNKIQELLNRLVKEFKNIKKINKEKIVSIPKKTMVRFKKLIDTIKSSFDSNLSEWGHSVYNYGDVAHGNIFFDKKDGCVTFIDPPLLVKSIRNDDGFPTGIEDSDFTSFQAHIRMNGHKYKLSQKKIDHLISVSEKGYKSGSGKQSKSKHFLQLLNVAMPVGLWVKPKDSKFIYNDDQNTLKSLVSDFVKTVDSQFEKGIWD
ncbi:hypothetical protein ACFLZV_01545 [Candidatus Margulisiibacteriota bacterium]